MKEIMQLLSNQIHIMAVLRTLAEERGLDGYVGSLSRKIGKTKELLK